MRGISIDLSPEAARTLSIYRQRKWLVLFLLVSIPLGTYFASKQLDETYGAATSLIVRPNTLNPAVPVDQLFGVSADDAVRFIGTRALAEAAEKELETANTLAEINGSASGQLEESSGGATDFVTINATASTAEGAADVANAYAAAIQKTLRGNAVSEIRGLIRRVEKDADTLSKQDRKDSAEERARQLQTLRGSLASQDDATTVLEPAVPPSVPISPRPRRNAALAGVLALLLVAGIPPFLESLNRKLRDEDDLADLLGAPVFAVLPESAYPGHRPDAEAREAFQTLRASLRYFNVDNDLTEVLICGPGRSEGKTTVATNLSVALAQDETSVILVDGDLRKPQVAERLGVDDGRNVASVLIEEDDPVESLREVDLEGSGRLRVLASEAPSENPSLLLASKKMGDLVESLRDECDLLVIDTPPILVVSDALPLIRGSSGVILVTKADTTTRDAVSRARERIEAAGGSVLGGVLTGVKQTGSSRYSAYGYQGYGYE